ncbi:MAG: SHOCT domain-containing protein [Bacteroidales bacterium]
MGFLIFIGFGIVVILLLLYFKKNGPKFRIDKTAFDPSERTAIETLKERLRTGDITQQEYDEKVKEIVDKR